MGVLHLDPVFMSFHHNDNWTTEKKMTIRSFSAPGVYRVLF